MFLGLLPVCYCCGHTGLRLIRHPVRRSLSEDGSVLANSFSYHKIADYTCASTACPAKLSINDNSIKWVRVLFAERLRATKSTMARMTFADVGAEMLQ